MTVGADVPLGSGYVFRGIVQEYDPAFTVQPFVDVGVAVTDRFSVTFGTWNSLHTGSLSENLGTFYESRLAASAAYRIGRVHPAVHYTLYTSPAGGYDLSRPGGSIGISELAVSASVDDGGSWLPLRPSVLVAFETTDTQADFGRAKGIYVEGALRPTFAPGWLPVRVAVPVRLGLSGKDYFETFDGIEYRDHRFGYGQVGVEAQVPLRWLRRGTWEAHAGVHLVALNDQRGVEQAGDDEPVRFKPVVAIGFTVAF